MTAANEAKTAYLEGAFENETLADSQDLDADSTTAEAEAAIGAELTAQLDHLAADADVGDANFGNRTDTAQDQLLADATAAKAKA